MTRAEGGPEGAGPREPDVDPHVVPRVYLTKDIPPLGGVIKQRPEDFLVEEIPSYQPSGEGEHIYMFVQKKGMSTMELVALLSHHFGVHRSAIGYAGLKDKHAITRQVVSIHVPGKKTEDFPMLQHERVQVLWVDRHLNKLRPGHLQGNRFSVRIRGVPATGVLTAKRVIDRLAKVGVPNRVGEQRFGMLENNHLIGRHMVVGDFAEAVRELLGPNSLHPEMNPEARRLFTEGKLREALAHYPPGARTELIVLNSLAKGNRPKYALMALEESVLRYYLSAFQSAIFNAVLDARVAEDSLGQLRLGDVAVKHINGAAFSVTSETLVQPDTTPRLEKFEISPSGPMWGAAMLRTSGTQGELELAALAAMNVTEEQLAQFDLRSRGTLEGKRRPLRVPLIDPEVEGGVDEHGSYVRCAFELPRGSFATVVMREIIKPAAARLPGSDEE